MNGNSLGVALSSGGLAGAERSEGERSEPQRSAAPAKAGADSGMVSRPDPEVVAKAKRRTYTAEYKQRITAPIIMLTARGQETDKVVGLEVGADDYVTKPFSIKELLARVRAHLRRATNGVRTLERYMFGDVELDFRKYRALRGGRQIELSPREFEILKCLILHENEIVTRDQLLDEVWGLENYPITRTVDNHIAKLRQKIETSPSNPEHIITVHRIGYKFAS